MSANESTANTSNNEGITNKIPLAALLCIGIGGYVALVLVVLATYNYFHQNTCGRACQCKECRLSFCGCCTCTKKCSCCSQQCDCSQWHPSCDCCCLEIRLK